MSRLSPLSLSSLVSPNLTDVKNVAAANQKIYIFVFIHKRFKCIKWDLESVDAFLIVLEISLMFPITRGLVGSVRMLMLA